MTQPEGGNFLDDLVAKAKDLGEHVKEFAEDAFDNVKEFASDAGDNIKDFTEDAVHKGQQAFDDIKDRIDGDDAPRSPDAADAAADIDDTSTRDSLGTPDDLAPDAVGTPDDPSAADSLGAPDDLASDTLGTSDEFGSGDSFGTDGPGESLDTTGDLGGGDSFGTDGPGESLDTTGDLGGGDSFGTDDPGAGDSLGAGDLGSGDSFGTDGQGESLVTTGDLDTTGDLGTPHDAPVTDSVEAAADELATSQDDAFARGSSGEADPSDEPLPGDDSGDLDLGAATADTGGDLGESGINDFGSGTVSAVESFGDIEASALDASPEGPDAQTSKPLS